MVKTRILVNPISMVLNTAVAFLNGLRDAEKIVLLRQLLIIFRPGLSTIQSTFEFLKIEFSMLGIQSIQFFLKK